MKIHEDRSHMNIDTRWFEKGYIKEDVHSLRLQSLCTEAEAAANKQFYDSHTREEWDQYIRQASLESSAAMKPVMEAIAQDFVCYQYDENIPVSYGSDRWDLYFWCNPFNGAADASERDFSYFTLTFNERQTLEKRKKVCQQVLELLCSRFQEHPHLHVAVQYSIWFDHPKIHDAVERAKPRLHGLRCIQEQKEGKLLLQDGALLFKPKYAKKYARTLSQSQILSLSWELGVEDEEPDTDAAPVTLPYKKFGATHPIQLQVTSYLNGNLAIQMVTWESGDPEPWATLTVNLPGQRQKDHAFIDTNADSEFPTWLIRHGLAINMGSDVALAGIERISTLLAQIAFSYIVFCSYQKKTYRYLILAICLHSMYDFPLVLLDYSVSPFIFEIGLFLFSAILLLFTLKGVRGIHSNEKNN